MTLDDTTDQIIAQLRQRIEAAEQLLSRLKSELSGLMIQTQQQPQDTVEHRHTSVKGSTTSQPQGHDTTKWPLRAEEYRRYGRQLILPEIGSPGQVKLKQSRVLIIGVGGLGCPAATYLAGAGIGTIGLVDGDVVEESNLHRQIAHDTTKLGWNKAESAAAYLRRLNPLVQYKIHPEHLTSSSALPLFKQYDIVLDCTDHPTSRYLISDACVLTGRSLVSASALKTDGQLIVLNHPPRSPGDLTGGPCYRCIFPTPPPPERLVSCGEGGILGPVVGTMGVLQALEAIRVLMQKPDFDAVPSAPRAKLLLFSSYSNPQFRSMKMRSRRPNCASCSEVASINEDTLTTGSLDYAAFCGGVTYDVLPSEARLDATTYAQERSSKDGLLMDVRDATQYAICHLDDSINVPWNGDVTSWTRDATNIVRSSEPANIYLVCRQGNDSQLAAAALMREINHNVKIKDIRGGFRAWQREVDGTWPDY